MSRSLPRSRFSELEDQLRVALRQKAAATPIADRSSSDARGTNNLHPSRKLQRRRGVMIAAGALVAAATTVAAFAYDGSTTDVRTTPAAPSGPATPSLPEAEVPRLLIEDATFLGSDGSEGASPVPADSTTLLQAFRRVGQLDGPMIFLITLRPYDPSTFGLVGGTRAEPVDLRGQVGYVSHVNGEQGATTMSLDLRDGNAIYLTAIGVRDEELVAFVNGLDPRPDGTWVATIAPDGLSEVTVSPPPADGRYYGGSFEMPGGVSVEVNLYQDGFEDRLRDRVNSTVRPVESASVDGVPAALGAYGATDWWVLLEPEPGRALELRIQGGDRAAVDRVLSEARFVDEATWDGATADP